MITLFTIVCGFLLDLVCGDPYWLPHPVRLIGKLITLLEHALYTVLNNRIGGVLLLLAVVAATFSVTYYITKISVIIEIIVIYTIFATRSLGNEAMKIYRSLNENRVDRARQQISYLVSRDTAGMDKYNIIRSTIETVTENIVDGIIAPMFYLFSGGAACGMTYKAINTLDSMVGYKNERYAAFGWASAKLDDLANFIPARVTAFVFIPTASLFIGGNMKNALVIARRDRFNHASPNSAHAEAAAAGALGIRLGGPTSYFGKMQNKPHIGDAVKALDVEDIRQAVNLMYVTACVGLILMGSLYAGITALTG